jgi:purine nucleosidase
MRRVIIDTDPGTDDALALMMALNSPDLAVEGITTVGGNATLSETTENALRLMEYLEGPDCSIPIAVGTDRPLHGSYTHAYHVHGSDGLGIALPAPTLRTHNMNAVDFLRDRVSASPGQLTLIAIGPLTNVAAALDNRPDIAEAVPEIIVMGGAVGVRGNITPHAEFNIHEDPWAANAVFESGIPVTLVGLDVTHQTFMHRRDGPQWFEGDSKSAQLGNSILTDRFRELDGEDEFHLHDPLAVAAAIEPDVLTCRAASVSVVTDGEERGGTVANYGEGSVKVAVGVDVERAVGIVRGLVSRTTN